MEIDIRREVIQNIKKLPTLPIIFEKILETIDDPKSSASILQETIKNDQSITAKILNMANSAYYGYSKRVSELSRAIVILGFDMVKNIALSVSVLSMFPEKNGNNLFDKEKFWLHSIGCGYLGKIVAEYSHFYEPDKAFIACLLHDVGKIVLDCYFEDEYKKVLNYSMKENVDICVAEEKVIDCNHSEIGFLLGEKWNFPEELLCAIRYHHQPQLAPHRHSQLTYLTYLTNLICQEAEIGTGGSFPPIHIDEKAMANLNLSESHLKKIKTEIQDMREKLEMLIHVIN